MSLRGLLLILGLAAAGAAAGEPIIDHWAVKGLHKPARIVVDRWGIAHIFARDQRDAYYLQGYNAGRERLWQIDLWRKRGLGLLSASFGSAYVDEDRAARLFLYRGDMAAEWAAYAPGAQATVEAFTAGINAYVGEVRRGAKPLPVEFTLTSSQPDFWKAEDVVRIRSHALVANLRSEVARAQVACVAGLAADAVRKRLEPPHTIVAPAGLDPCVVTNDVLKDYILATEPVAFTAGANKVAALDPDVFTASVDAEGSNNWVVAASRTATGRPLLANDPHRALGVPSLRYIVHLNAPGLDVIGAGEPALPGVSFGHNEAAAWGITIFGIDQEDLYVYALDPADPDRYRYGADWEPMRVVREAIPVKGEAARTVELRFTRHGPVLLDDPAHGRAFALRTVWSEPGASGYFQASWLTNAATWKDFMAAHEHWGAPPLNLVFADTAGEVGWAASGLTPVRPNWDGLMPVPGDGRYEWRGFLKGENLPVSRNAGNGWFATANEMNLPAGFPNEARKVSFEWSDRSRIDRIEAVLRANSHVSVADAQALQTDSVSPMSLRLTALAGLLSAPDARAARALALLAAWNHEEGAGSAAAAIYEVWTGKHLGPAVVRQAAPAAAAVIGLGNVDAAIAWLEQHPKERAAVLIASLSETLDELGQRLGPDMDAWTWGALHHATFIPAIAPLADAATREAMSVGPAPLPGGPSTPKAATWDPTDFNTIAGASVRMVLDVGAWDNSVIVNTPGQSGDPASPHYRDLFPLWANGRYVPLLFSRPVIDSQAERVIALTPAG